MTAARTLRKSFSLVLALFLAAAMFAGCKNNGADDLLKGKAAYNIKDYKEAARSFSLAAEKGNVEAQYLLGQCFEFGYGVDLNWDEAKKWYRKAAEKGDVKAQYALGNIFMTGEFFGIAPDRDEAMKWLRKAAEKGDAKAQYAIVTLSLPDIAGKEADKDEVMSKIKKAVPGILKEAEEGDVEAMAAMILHHDSIEKDSAVVERLTGKLIGLAEGGDDKAQMALGVFYGAGIGVVKDEEEGVKWVRKSAENGNQKAKRLLELIP